MLLASSTLRTLSSWSAKRAPTSVFYIDKGTENDVKVKYEKKQMRRSGKSQTQETERAILRRTKETR